jgi:xylose isomerase
LALVFSKQASRDLFLATVAANMIRVSIILNGSATNLQAIVYCYVAAGRKNCTTSLARKTM